MYFIYPFIRTTITSFTHSPLPQLSPPHSPPSPATPDAVEDRQTLRETWLKEMFEKASKNNSGGFIDQNTCIKLIKRLDSHVAMVRVRQKLQVNRQQKFSLLNVQ